MTKADKLRVPSLERSPSHLLHGALQLALDVYAEEVGSGGLTQRQFAVLAAAAERHGLTQTDLVRATGVDRSTLADMIARLIKRGLLTRERSTDDARANAVALTDEGRAALAEAAPRVEAADARILAALPTGKRDGFLTQLHALASPEAVEPELAAEAKTEKRKKKDKGEKAEKKRRKKARKAAQAVQPAQAAPSAPEPAD